MKKLILILFISITFLMANSDEFSFANSLLLGFKTPDSVKIIPKKALIRSAIIPGWGQLYVKKPIKSLFFVAAEAYHIYTSYYYHDIYLHVKDTKNDMGIDAWSLLTTEEKQVAVKNHTGYSLKLKPWKPEEMRNKRLWWVAGFYIIGMVDAYVDAHLYYFPKGDMEFINDQNTQSKGIRFSFPIGANSD